jgi:FlaG/FlaF family flagellin (archaellin)
MVAITVILAAVIGAFVLEIGDQQETAPSTSFDSEQVVRFYSGASAGYCNGALCNTNLTTVSVSHAGGNVVDIAQTDIKVEGNGSAWGPENTDDGHNGWESTTPSPDVRLTLGTNEKAEFTSGQTWEVYSYEGFADERVENGLHQVNYEDTTADEPNPGPTFKNNPTAGGGLTMTPLEQGQSVNVVWTASSGGKTQTLFKYSVQ